MPYCFYCGAAFSRDEHLERHILTHTNAKPYKCFTCYMAFGRRDLLNRHYAVHGKDSNQQPLPPTEGIIPKPARRTPIACKSCAKTKTKCDRKVPCTRCASRNLTCEPRPSRRVSKSFSTCGTPSEGDSLNADEEDLARLSLEESAYIDQESVDMYQYHNQQTPSSEDMSVNEMQTSNENAHHHHHQPRQVVAGTGTILAYTYPQFQPQFGQSRSQALHHDALSHDMQGPTTTGTEYFTSPTTNQINSYNWDYTQMQPEYSSLEIDGQQYMTRPMMRWDLNGY